jgi:hypothetical protein
LLKAVEEYVRNVAEDLTDLAEQEKVYYHDLKQDLNNIQSNEENSRRAKEN